MQLFLSQMGITSRCVFLLALRLEDACEKMLNCGAGIVCTLSNVSVAAVFLAPHGYRHYLFCHEGAHVAHEEPSDSDLCMF